MIRRPEVQVPRDRWGRPTINGTTYTRTSTLAKQLDDQSNLIAWKARMAVIGLSRNPDLLSLAATTDAKDNRKLNDIVERATERAGATSGRDMGTSIHAVTEALDYGEDVSHMPVDLVADAQAYVDCCESLGAKPVLAETFVVNDAVYSAGTFDRLMRDEDGFFVGDIKTGSKDDPVYAAKYSALSWSIQLATYAQATPWDEVYRSWEALNVGAPSRERGLIFYIPRGSGKCYPIWIDLAHGWRAAILASQVRDIAKRSAVIA